MSAITILYMDRESYNRTEFEQACQSKEGIEGKTGKSSQEGLHLVEDGDIIISSFQLDKTSGPDFFEEVSKKVQDRGYVLYTDEEDAEILAKIGETPFMLVRPSLVSYEELIDKAVTAYRERRFSSYPLVEDESDRSKRAEAVSISEEQQQKLDELTMTVRQEFDADKAFVELMEVDEQIFITTCGFEDESMSREASICTHALVHEGIYVIEDVRNDPRFMDNKQVKGLDIGFYAGAILTVGGLRVGTLCVTDTEPKTMSETGKTSLREYADKAESILER